MPFERSKFGTQPLPATQEPNIADPDEPAFPKQPVRRFDRNKFKLPLSISAREPSRWEKAKDWFWRNPATVGEALSINHTDEGDTRAWSQLHLGEKVLRAASLPGRITGKASSAAIWAGTGVISWPFERVSGAIGTPMQGALDARRKTLESRGEDASKLNLIRPRFDLTKEESLREFKEMWPGIKGVVKSFASKKMPEDTTQLGQFVEDAYGEYYEGLTGEKSPPWVSKTMGGASEFLVTPWATGKILKGIGKAGKLTGIPQKIEAARIPEFQRAKMRTRMKIGARGEKATEIGSSLGRRPAKKIAKELALKSGKHIGPRAVQQRYGQIIKGGITQQESLKKVTTPVIEEFAKNAKELRRLGILGEETYLTKLPKKRVATLTAKKTKLQKELTRIETAPHYVGTREISASFPGRSKKIQSLQTKIGGITDKINASSMAGAEKYLPRMYRSKEQESIVRQFFGWSNKRIRAHYAKQRQKIPLEVRKMMGEIKEPAYPVMKRLLQQGADIETGKLFDKVAKNPSWSSSVAVKGMKQLPDTKGLGTLRGKYVQPRIYNDVMEMTHIRGKVEQLYDTAIGSWKLGKVVWNPATHFRNKISNKILLDLSGMGYEEQAKYSLRALNEYRKNTKEYQVAKRYFARTTLVRGEIMDDILKAGVNPKGVGFEKALNSIKGGVKYVSKKPSQLYQHEEFVNKFMKYLQQRDRGKSVIEAVEEGNKWLFDYSDLTRLESTIMRRVMPFYTFPRKAVPRVIEAMAVRPHTIAKYPLMAKAMTQYSLSKLNMTYDDYEAVKKVLPDYMDSGSYILMPYRDDNGDLRFFDWTYIIPWGNVAEAQERGVLESVVTNPLVNLVGDVMRNKSSFTDREIWKETDTPREMAWKKTEYIWRNLTPALAPKGIYWDKLRDSATGRPTASGKKLPMKETISHTVFGLRTQPVDIKMSSRFKAKGFKYEIRELKNKIFSARLRLKNGNITKEEYNTQIKQYKSQIIERGNSLKELSAAMKKLKEKK